MHDSSRPAKDDHHDKADHDRDDADAHVEKPATHADHLDADPADVARVAARRSPIAPCV
jgi:hypothetical protein